jgi:Tfp pilus assembly ATPase PilU
MLADDGFPMTHDSAMSVIQLGYSVCATLHASNMSEEQAVSRILRDMPDADPRKAQMVVAAAHSQLCPDASGSH